MKGKLKMSKLTKKQQKTQQMMEGFNQPATAVDAIPIPKFAASL